MLEWGRKDLPMPGVQRKGEDVFHVLGFTRDEIANGVQLRSLQINMEAMRVLGEMNHRFGPLAQAAAQGLLVEKLIEVYSLDSFGDNEKFEKLYDSKYMVVEFFNDTALNLASQFNIKLPPVIGKITRAELPQPLGISMLGKWYIAA
jgi:hypothetical protein